MTRTTPAARSRGITSWCLAALSVSALVTAATAVPGVAAATSPRQAVTATDPAPGGRDGAMDRAYRTREPVEILEERTETSQSYAYPDGTFSTRTAPAPVRVRTPDGWRDINNSLRFVDGVVKPVAPSDDLVFSSGNTDGPAATLNTGGVTLRMFWKAPDGKQLPTPVLDDDVAVYRDVLPGVDLRLAAGNGYFSKAIVVNSRAAAANPALETLRFRLEASGATLHQDDDGTITLTAPDGHTVFTSDGAAMWENGLPSRHDEGVAPDASTDTTDQGTDERPDHPHTPPPPQPKVHYDDRLAEIPMALRPDGVLEVKPDLAILRGEKTVFPVYIDPNFTGGKEIWTVVNRSAPGTSYWADKFYRKEMRVGQEWDQGATHDWRTLIQFKTGEIEASKILSASFYVSVVHTARCANTQAELWQTAAINNKSKTTWNNTKDGWLRELDTATVPKANKQSCPVKGNKPVEFSGRKLVQAFQDVADAGKPTITFGLRADEDDAYEWKKFVADSAYLEVRYDRAPGKAVGTTMDSCLNSCTSPALVRSHNPSLTMQAKDPDGGVLRYVYEIFKAGANPKTDKPVVSSNDTVTGVKNNALRSWPVPPKSKLTDGAYQWRGRACDGDSFCGPYSDWYIFTVDTTGPGLPAVSSDLYRAADSGSWNGGPGVAGTFVFTPGAVADKVSSYQFHLLRDGRTVTLSNLTKGVGSTQITPTQPGPEVMTVRALDAAGNISGEFPYRFLVADPEGKAQFWNLDDGNGTVGASQPDNQHPLHLTSGVTWADGGRQGDSALHFAGAGAAATETPVLDTLAPGGFTVAAWVRLTDLQSPHTALSQVGRNGSMFELGFRNDLDGNGDKRADRQWCFTVKAADAAGAAEYSACTAEYVAPNDWVHLVGVYDRAQNSARLYVNGTPALDGSVASAKVPATFSATGAFVVGAGTAPTTAVRAGWAGDVDTVWAEQRLWTDGQINSAADPCQASGVGCLAVSR